MSNKTAPVPDQDALKRVGAMVRKRLDADAQAYKIPTDRAEIYAIGNFLSPEECQRLMRMIDAVARPSELHETAYVAKFRTSYSGNFNPHDPFVKAISRRIDDTLGLPGKVGESIQGQRYLPGQEFKPHNDWFYTDQEYWNSRRSAAVSAAGPRWLSSTRSRKAGTRISSRSAPRSNPSPAY